ncbi:hypothetical protein [Sphingobacterium deserti]|nr:hypothetical protein [Sphingobacterium deserti]
MTKQSKQEAAGMLLRKTQMPEAFLSSVFMPEPTDPPKERKCPIEIL